MLLIFEMHVSLRVGCNLVTINRPFFLHRRKAVWKGVGGGFSATALSEIAKAVWRKGRRKRPTKTVRSEAGWDL